MSDTKETSLKYLPFSGKKGDWRMWSGKFLARARKKGYKNVLLGKEKVPQHDASLDPTNPDEKKLLDARVANENAYDDLIVSMEEKVSYGKGAEAVTDELTDGDAALAWTALTKKFKPKTVATKAELLLEFMSMKLEDWTKDPDEWIDDVEEI